MKIIHLISGGDTGGAKTHVLSLLQGLGKSESVYLACFMEGPFAQEARELGINTIVMDSGGLFSVARRLIELIRGEGIEIVHCHGSRANMMGAMIKSRIDAVVLTTVHSDYRLDYLGRPLDRLVYGTINKIALRLLDFRIGVSDAMSDMLVSRGFDPYTVYTIYNGVDVNRGEAPVGREEYLRSLGVSFDGDTVVFGIAARFHPVKDIPTLLRAFAEAVKSRPNIRLLIAGDGDGAGKLKKQAQDTCPAGSVVFTGWIMDMDSFYNALDVNCLTSLSETFPYALTEGGREHCATIASRVGGVPYLIENGRNGLLFTAGNSGELAKHMLTLADDANLRARLSDALYATVAERFSFEATVEAQLELYASMLRRRGRKKRGRDGVVICGAYGMGNAGDEAILEAIVGQMRSLDSDMPICVMTRTPRDTALKLHVRTSYTFNSFSYHRAMRRSVLYLNGGGSLIQDVTSSRSLMYYLSTLASAKRRGCRVLMYGCGIGPVNKRRDRRAAKRYINRYVDAITLREEHSAAELERCGITEPEIVIASDPALTLPAAEPETVGRELASRGIDPDGKYICFCLRPWKGFEARVPDFAAACEYAYEKYGLTPVFLSVNHLSDGETAAEVADRLSCPHHVLRELIPTPLTLGIMSRMSAVVSMRLHGLIFAASRGVPLVGVSYDPKVNAFLEYIGQNNCVSLDALSAPVLCGLIDRALASPRAELDAGLERLMSIESMNEKTAARLLGLEAQS